MASEIERKFLVEAMPDWLEDHESDEVRQGYLAISGDAEVRVREAGGSATLTVKRGHGRSREETEIDLTDEQFSRLWPGTEGCRVFKRRFKVPLEDKLTAEVDVYSESLEGLCTVEVEFGGDEQADRFSEPGWFGKELTGNDEFTNQTLAVEGLPGGR